MSEATVNQTSKARASRLQPTDREPIAPSSGDASLDVLLARFRAEDAARKAELDRLMATLAECEFRMANSPEKVHAKTLASIRLLNARGDENRRKMLDEMFQAAGLADLRRRLDAECERLRRAELNSSELPIRDFCVRRQGAVRSTVKEMESWLDLPANERAKRARDAELLIRDAQDPTLYA